MDILTIAKNKKFNLPLRWDGEDFAGSLNKLYDDYILSMDDKHFGDIERICNGIIYSIKEYLSGFPSKAYSAFYKVFMELMEKHRAHTYIKDNVNDKLPDLFRVRKVDDILEYRRRDLFHVPFNKCRYVSTTRYSIAGFPSLYLATSFNLCIEETCSNVDNHLIGGLFRQDENFNEFVPQIVELGVKPNDFLWRENREQTSLRFGERWKHINKNLLDDPIYQDSYLYWYPLVAACSFIRVNRNDFFAPEYIIPQLLMQAIRDYSDSVGVVGIRYFSCASKRASEQGLNYVFPTTGIEYSNEFKYCYKLSNIFAVSQPVYLNEFEKISQCEFYLKRFGVYKKIFIK